ncbi:hypothetical protein C8Q74DRAFT_1212931 [Fomes fomentarius]|nr:hypothetical protein C8Q74DRAFT_1212931 [Fomes fomentarius]
MKFFSNLFVTAAVVVVGIPNAFAALTGDQVVGAINAVADQSSNVADAIRPLNAVNFPIQGGIIAQGLGNLTNTVAQDNALFDPNQAPFDDPTAQTVVDALVDFVAIHQALLNVIIGKSSLAAQFGFTAPIAAALRAIEAQVDTLALNLIALIPTQEPAADAQFAALDGTFDDANTAYGA